MNLYKTSIRSRFFLLLVFSVLFWILTGFITLNQIEKINRFQVTSDEINSLLGEFFRLENAMNSFYTRDFTSEAFHETGRSDAITNFNRIYLGIYTRIKDIKSNPIISRDLILDQKLEHMQEFLSRADDHKESIREKSRTRGWNSFGLSGSLLDQIAEFDPPVTGDIGELSQELISEFGIYLVKPAVDRRNDILNLAGRIESILPPPDPLSANRGYGQLRGLLSGLRNLLQLDLELGLTGYEGLKNQVFSSINILQEEAAAFKKLWTIEADRRIRQAQLGIIALIVITAVVIGTVLYFTGKSIQKYLNTLKSSTEELVAGRIPAGISSERENEFSEISEQLNRFVLSLKQKEEFAASLAEGRNPGKMKGLGRDDSLANSLNNLARSLQAAKLEEEKHRKSREERRWANEGVAKFGEILRIHNKDIESLCENVIQELVKYLDASAGGIFLLDEQEDPGYELMASFAFDRKKHIKSRVRQGEGLVGTCAIEKEKIYLTDVPDDYINIASGFGESKPNCLLLMPLLLEDITLGVLEIASLKKFSEYEIEFVDDLAESIASAVSAVQMNMRTAELLEQSRKQAREMAKQEEIMRQNVEELQTTQEESARRESEISGILNGIHNSSHVAEFNVNEELISMNDRFLQLLQNQRNQLIGKKYHEITGVSRHTDSFREFWQEIRDGKTNTRIDKITLPTGTEIWLRQTFTPIIDSEGGLLKVLLIAADITETVEQKESLEKQSAELNRANIEMKSFSDAVDQALIKCVYSPSGQILEMNEIYEHVTGYTRKEMLGKNNRVFLQRVEKEQFDKIWSDIQKDKPYSGVIRRTKPTGEEVWIMSSFTPVKDENGNIFKVFFLGQDITERKLKYQLLEEANKEIDRLRQELDERK
jgi:PAS domain S-box-containing protein